MHSEKTSKMQLAEQVKDLSGRGLKPFWIGYFFVAFITVSAFFYKWNFINPVTITLQIGAYIYWTFLVACLHKAIKAKNDSYHFGPRESMAGALIPFAYIFWNWCWVVEAGKYSGLSKNFSLLLGGCTALASILAYPDNLLKFPASINLIALFFLFAQAKYLKNRLSEPIAKSSTRLEVPSNPSIIRDQAYFQSEAKIWLGLALSGCLFGLIAPGFNQWYLAWFGLLPLLFSTFTSKNPPQAFYRGVFFGYSYNLVYSIFILQFGSCVWPENLRPLTVVANTVVWLLFSLQQAALYGTFCFISRWLPLYAGILPKIDWKNKSVKLPLLFIVPLLWILVFNKLGNHLSSLAMPWTLIEYSQWQQISLIQCASVIGGIGIAALIVMTNVTLALLIASFAARTKLTNLVIPDRPSFIATAVLMQILIGGALFFGYINLQHSTTCDAKKDRETFSILQGNILFGLNEIDPAKHWNRYLSLAKSSPPGVCVWPEWSMPVSISKYPKVFEKLAAQAKENKQDWIIGAIDSDKSKNYYNAAVMLGKTGKLEKEIYHKQYLVPFGEHSPSWILNSPLGELCGTFTPSRKGFTQGTESITFSCGKNKITPLICCELISPELASKGIRQGGEILVDCSNTMWFQTKLLGDQSFAVCIFRAIENHRYFVFGTSIGPSAFIDWHGRILKTAPINESVALTQEVKFDSRLTPFTTWFR